MSGRWRVVFNRACPLGREQRLMERALNRGAIAGNGPCGQACERILAAELGSPRVLLTTSGTHALEMAALLLDLRRGDEVIVPSFTFSSTAAAFALRGARTVFADIRPDTLNLDERLLPGVFTRRTRAVVPVHYAGVGCEMDSILDQAASRGVAVVEDNAHGLFGRYRGRPLGSFGCMAAHSFHETKNITCGEGGAIALNDARYIARAEILREKGTNRAAFFRGEVDKYTWVDVGSSYVLSDLLAACLLGQLQKRRRIQAARRRIWERYERALRDWAGVAGVRLPTVPAHCEQAYHMFYLLLPDAAARTGFLSHLRARRVYGVFHYLPLHLSPAGRKAGGRAGQCPVTEDVCERLVRLPFYTGMSRVEQDAAIEAVRAWN